MAKVRVKFDKRKATAEVIKEISEVTNTTELRNELGIFITDRIRFQARIGKPLNDDGDFKDLEPDTVFNREYLQSFNVTHPTYSPDRSNLTFTGQFLNSIGFTRIRNGVALIFKGRRRPYKTGPNGVGQSISNEKLSRLLASIGFKPFSKKGIEGNARINRQVNQLVRRFLRRKLRR